MKKTNLGKAVSIALFGSTLALGANVATAHTMYNTYNAGFHSVGNNKQGGMDGFNVGSWEGTDSTSTVPFGYTGAQRLHWAAMIHSDTSAMEISTADAQARYGLDADIDTAKGAWYDGLRGWAHQTDYGLMKSMVDTKVTLSLSSVNGGIGNFGITVFTGMDVGTGYYAHSEWNLKGEGVFVGFTDGVPIFADVDDVTNSNPHGTEGVNYYTHSETSTLTFTALADQVYSIYLGGNDGGSFSGPHDGYVMSIQASPVPLPAAVWLFGSGLLGVLGWGQRKTYADA